MVKFILQDIQSARCRLSVNFFNQNKNTAMLISPATTPDKVMMQLVPQPSSTNLPGWSVVLTVFIISLAFSQVTELYMFIVR